MTAGVVTLAPTNPVVTARNVRYMTLHAGAAAGTPRSDLMTRSVFSILAGASLLAVTGCQTMVYDDPPRPRFNENYLGTPPQSTTALPRETVAPVTPTDVYRPPVTPVPRSSSSQTTQLPSNATAPAREIPIGTPVAGKPGFVTSPYKPTAGYVDVRGFSPGEQVKCPYSGKIFLVP